MGHKVTYFKRNASFIQAAAGRYSSHMCDNDVGTEGDGDAVNMSGRWPWLGEFVLGLSS